MGSSTDGAAAHAHEAEGPESPCAAHDPGHSDEEDHAEDVLDAGKVHAQQRA